MRTFDLTPLFRSTVGFDSVARMMDAAMRMDDAALSYPPYNIEKLGEDNYRISMAVAGFAESDLGITTQENALVVSGRQQLREPEEAEEKQYLHRGIATRAFERRFQLADHIRVTDASLVNGMLHIDLVREVPEAMKPRTIAIAAAKSGEMKGPEKRAEIASPRKQAA
ncbi:MAG: Hsp20 family protein [Alphaproteobacteria bacterium]|nr:MAG: Hsp20 family protein [Alphaproteobacteria bacterium]